MMTIRQALLVITGVMVVALVATAGLVRAEEAKPLGMFTPTPVLERSCIAVRVPVSKKEALAGIRWYNNDERTGFPKLLVASGLKDLPPIFADGIVVAEDLTGVESGWSQFVFEGALASDTGALYVIFQLPANTEGTDAGDGPGFAYVKAKTPSSVYVSADGDDWTKIGSGYQLLVDPVYTHRDAAGVTLKCSRGAAEDPVEEIPEVVVEKTELMHPYPNPFNPVTTIEFALKSPGPVELVVFDLRGRRVKVLENSYREMGVHQVSWYGDGHAGQRVASGVYFARLVADGKNLTRRMLLVK